MTTRRKKAFSMGTTAMMAAVMMIAAMGSMTAADTNFPNGGGEGTAEKPYQIHTVEELAGLATLVNTAGNAYYDKHYILMDDLDLSNFGNWIPIGNENVMNSTQTFVGVFNGNNKTITGLTINSGNRYYVGLFGCLGRNLSRAALVHNLGLVDVNITNGTRAGGLAGYTLVPAVIIKDCFVTGTVRGSSYAGGIVGFHNGVIENCWSTATIIVNTYSVNIGGGIAGSASDPNTKIINSVALNPSISIYADAQAGRVVGDNNNLPELLINTAAFSGMTDPGIGKFNDNTFRPLTRNGTDITPAAIIFGDGTLGNRFTTANGWTVEPGTLPGFGKTIAIPDYINNIFDGAGTPTDPYQISTVANLVDMQFLVNGRFGSFNAAHYKLMNDLDLSSISNWTPIGSGDQTGPGTGVYVRFHGTFDGNGKVISNLTITDGQRRGLFGMIEGATIRNLGIENANITGTSTVGVIIGATFGNHTIENCYTTGTVSGLEPVGGIVGSFSGNAGSSGGTMRNCYSTATVSASGGNGMVGGLVGLVGVESNITNCAALNASVTGSQGVGRVVGSGAPFTTATNTYAYAGMTVSPTGSNSVNGTDLSGLNIIQGGTGSTLNSIFTGSPWAVAPVGKLPGFTATGVDMPSHIKLFESGAGTSGDPYIINTAAQLADLATLVNAGNTAYNAAHYRLGANIDLGVAPYNVDGGWVPIGNYAGPTANNSFRGTFDGNNKVISNLTINRPTSRYMGLFGYIDGGTVMNLGVVDIDISGAGSVGGIVGSVHSNGKVENSYTTGRIRGSTEVGGVVGDMAGSGSVSHCYSTAAISMSGSVGGAGGIVGAVMTAGVTVSNCVALNPEIRGATVGRVVGDAHASSTYTNNKARADMVLILGNNDPALATGGTLTNTNGADVTLGTAINTVFTGADWSTAATWTVPTTGLAIGTANLPILAGSGVTNPTLQGTVTGATIAFGTATYTGSELTPTVTVTTRGGTALTVTTHYTIGWSGDRTNANSTNATATITGAGNCIGTATGIFPITRATPVATNFNYSFTPVDYNGSNRSVSVSVANGLTGFGSGLTVKYNGSTDLPVNAGDYTVTVDVSSAGNNYSTVTGLGLGTFTINKIAPTAALLQYTPTEADYQVGVPKSVTVSAKDGVSGLGSITVKYNGNTIAPIGAGTYAITVDIDGIGTNYTAATNISLGNFTIEGISIPASDITVTPYSGVYDGAAHGISVTDAGHGIGGSVSTITYSTTQGGAYTSTNPTFTNVGSYTVYFQVDRTDEGFNSYRGSGTVTITAKPLTISGATIAAKTFDGMNSATVNSVSFNEAGTVPSIGSGITAIGTFTDVNAGGSKTVNITVTLTSTNYSLAINTYQLTGQTISKAAASGLTVTGGLGINVLASDLTAKTYNLDNIVLSPTNHGARSYTLGTFTDVGGAGILDGDPSLSGLNNATLNYTGAGEASGTATQVITIATANYADITATITFIATTCTHPDFTQWVNTATCLLGGTRTRNCTECGHEETESVLALGHSFGSVVASVSATCLTAGAGTQSCTRPGCSHTVAVVIPALGHTLSAWAASPPATCLLSGENTRSCSRPGCTHVETQALPALGHSIGPWVVTPATCQLPGHTTRSCSRPSCTHSETRDPTPALGHILGSWSAPTAASCELPGQSTRSCSRPSCGHSEIQTVTAALGHTLGSWEVVSSPACVLPGQNRWACTRPSCTHSETQSVVALGHTFGSSTTTVPATCLLPGESRRTCTRSICGHIDDSVISALGHSWGAWVVTVQPTRTSEGVRTRVCQRDPSHTESEILDVVTSISVGDRVVPGDIVDGAVVAPTRTLSSNLTAGPNPVCRGGNLFISAQANLPPAVNFYWQGRVVEDGVLVIYDALGNVVNKIGISEDVSRRGVARNALTTELSEPRRIIGTWDLKDNKGLQVSEGTYLVRGIIKGMDGTVERVSIVVGVR